MASVVEPSLQSRLSAAYNECIRSKDKLQKLNVLIAEAEKKGLQCKELAISYALRCDDLIERERFDRAYADADRAKRLFPNEIDVIHALINVHWRARDPKGKNDYCDDTICAKYTTKLESLGYDDPRVLEFCSRVYSSLSMYSDGLRCLSQARVLLMKQEGFRDIVCEMNRNMTEMHLNRYRSCPDEANREVLAYLVELLNFEGNTLDEDEKMQALSEMFERIQFIVSELQSGEASFKNRTSDRSLLTNSLDMVTFEGIGVTADVLELGRELYVLLEDAAGGVQFLTKCLGLCTSPCPLRSEIFLSRSCFYEQLGDTSRCHDDFITSNGDGGLSSSKFVSIKSQIDLGWRKREDRHANGNGIVREDEKTKEVADERAAEEDGEIERLQNVISALESELEEVKQMNNMLLYEDLGSKKRKESDLTKTKRRLRECEETMKKQARDLRIRDEIIQELRVEATCINERNDSLAEETGGLKRKLDLLERELKEIRGDNAKKSSENTEVGSKTAKQSGCGRLISISVQVLFAILAFAALVGIIVAGGSLGANMES